MPARLIIRLLFGFASDSVFVKLNQSTKSETAMLSCLFQNYLVSVQCHVAVIKEEPAPFQDIVTPIKYINFVSSPPLRNHNVCNSSHALLTMASHSVKSETSSHDLSM